MKPLGRFDRESGCVSRSGGIDRIDRFNRPCWRRRQVNVSLRPEQSLCGAGLRNIGCDRRESNLSTDIACTNLIGVIRAAH